ncbi:MAG: 4Fe-4S binding protein [Melioribacteraceae bacterium]|nr:4Fe-4S binding protein [Melioribacteraceae bacterium]
MQLNNSQILFTNKARCRDCYKCLRHCPVNAIKMEGGQAFVQIERCILCGTCLKECPQGAKQFRRDIEVVKKLIAENENIAVSIAPSFPALFEEWQWNRIPSLLRKLGFTFITETAEAAYHTAVETEHYFSKKNSGMCLSTACPSFVNYIEKYSSENVDSLTPIVSPMIAHARRLKRKLGYETKIVFIGPCLAKKAEAEREEHTGLIDAVLTFTELVEWIEEFQIDFKSFEPCEFDELVSGSSRLFSLSGGMAKTASLETDNLNSTIYAMSGIERIEDSIQSFQNTKSKILIEPLICASGCVNGPGLPRTENIYSRKDKVIRYSRLMQSDNTGASNNVDLRTGFDHSCGIKDNNFTEAQLRQILEQTGKTNEEDQLNCGACGYISCIENAKAILMNMVEIESCIPYMRRLAEQRTDKIIESSPNGIVIINNQLEILHVNPAFKKFFMCTNSIIGKRISYLIDPEPFVKVKDSETNMVEITQRHDSYGITCHQFIYKMPDEDQYIGIFVDITKNITDVEKLDTLREETIGKAQELLEHQIEMAQQLAKLLGENTAKGESLVENLLKLTQDEKMKNLNRKKNWLWDTYTSK